MRSIWKAKTSTATIACAIIMGALSTAAPINTKASEPSRVVVNPRDNGADLVNPDMGWVIFYYDNGLTHYGNREEPNDTLADFPGLSVVYFRLSWGFMEPEKGKINWSLVDGPAQRFIDRGLKVAFRFSCYEGHSGQFDSTPRWVRDAGAKGDIVKERDDKEYWQPRYDDPIFLKHLEDFLAAAAKRYDGSPNVAWIDVGSFGMYGEGHTKTEYSRAVRQMHVDLHTKYFKHTLIALNDDLGKEPGRTAKLDDLIGGPGRFTLRDDSILVNPELRAYRSAHLADLFWQKEPVILESEHYIGPKKANFWDHGRIYLETVESYRASYVSAHWFPREFLKENRDLVHAANLRMGYRLNLLEASWPARIKPEGAFSVTTQWKNAGVAPCYPGGFVALTLKTKKEGIVATFVDESWNLRDLGVDAVGPDSKIVQYNDGSSKQSSTNSIRSIALPVRGSAPVHGLTGQFTLAPVVKPGKYKVYVSVGDRDGTPRIELPLDHADQHRRYCLGQLEVAP